MAERDGVGPNKFEEMEVSDDSKRVLLSRWDCKEAWVPLWMWRKCESLYDDMRTFDSECVAEDILEDHKWVKPKETD